MSNSDPNPHPIGLALAGGGPAGAVYEIGALRALDEALVGVDFNQFVIDRFAETSDFTEPTSINLLNFVFDDDPAAFDVLLVP